MSVAGHSLHQDRCRVVIVVLKDTFLSQDTENIRRKSLRFPVAGANPGAKWTDSSETIPSEPGFKWAFCTYDKLRSAA